ncbi:MAG: hypothetical protein ACI8T1_004068 [Verrucomicrobiales bacterium]|jgi:uncharacterized protein (TIGR02597 family)
MNRILLITSTALLGWTSFVSGQTTSSTPPIGFIRKDCPANSDTRISIPLERSAVFMGPLVTITGDTLTVEGSPAWTTNQFKYVATGEAPQLEHYYVLFLTGTHAGRQFDILENETNTLKLDLGAANLTGVVAGDRIKLLPHWTLDAAFPDGDGVVASTFFETQTELLVQDTTTKGINLGPVQAFYFHDDWKDPNTAGNSGTTVIPTHRPLLVRNRDTATSAVFVGVVPSDTQAVPIRVPAGTGQQDNFVALNRPVPVKLRDSGLDSVISPSISFLSIDDEILVYDEEQTEINKSPKFTYYRDTGGTWRNFDDLESDAGDVEIFTPGTGVIIRKTGTGGTEEQTIYWTHTDPTQ